MFLVPTGTAANAPAAHVMAKRVYFVLKEEITVGSWPRATLNFLMLFAISPTRIEFSF